MTGQTIFVSGGNRGIGFELVKQFAAIPGNSVIATTRNIAKSPELSKLAEQSKNVKIVTVDVSSQASIDALEKELPGVIGEGLDVFISNAAIGDSFYTILDAPREVYQEHYNVNVLGAISLAKIVYPYLLKKDTRKIVFISSLLGKINDILEISVSSYSQSKAALNYSAKALSFELESEKFIVVPVHPGVVSTDMGNFGRAHAAPDAAKQFDKMTITPAQSGEALVKLINSLTSESNGKFYSYDGTVNEY